MADSDIIISPTTGLPSAALTPRSVDRGGGVREAVHSLAKQDGTRIDPATAQGQASMLTALASLALGTDVQAGTAKAEASRALLASILTAIQAQRVETIWTDDTGTRFIRVDIGGSIVWTDVTGAGSSAPGAGARPDSDSGTVVSRTSYQATANGTGFATGDFLDHIVVTDGDAGDLVSNFWINVTAGTRVAAPSSANITPMSVLPTGAATDTKLELIRLLLAGTLGISAASLPLPTGAATQTTLAAVLTALGGLPTSLGAKARAASLAIGLSTEDQALLTAISTALAGMLSVAPIADELRHGTVGSDTKRVTAAPTLTPGTYQNNKCMGGLVTLPAFLRVAGKSATLQSASIHAKIANTAQIDVVIFRDAPSVLTGLTDNTTFAIDPVDFDKVSQVLSFATWSGLGTPSLSRLNGIGAMMSAASGVDLKAIFVARGPVAIASASDLLLGLGVYQD